MSVVDLGLGIRLCRQISATSGRHPPAELCEVTRPDSFGFRRGGGAGEGGGGGGSSALSSPADARGEGRGGEGGGSLHYSRLRVARGSELTLSVRVHVQDDDVVGDELPGEEGRLPGHPAGEDVVHGAPLRHHLHGAARGLQQRARRAGSRQQPEQRCQPGTNKK